MRHDKTTVLIASLFVVAFAVPLALKAQLNFSRQQFARGGFSSSSRPYEYFCHNGWQSTPCSSFSSLSSLSSSSQHIDYFCNGTIQGTPCSTASSFSFSSSSASMQPLPLFSDLSVILDTDHHTVGAGENITYTVKVRNGGKDVLYGAKVFLLRNDMSYIESSAFCVVQDSDSTYVRCTVPVVPAEQSVTFTVTLQAAPHFSCIESTGGRSVLAFVRAPSDSNVDLYPQNNTSNIVNTMPVCQ
jgi:uncharacterized repeat protein (TIGR01451 family)